jgi:DivIVA domain-containing protein
MADMELSPQAVAAATFKTVKRGYDPDEVRAYLIEVSASLEASHQQATAMEARARAAIAKLQDATQHPSPAPASARLASDEAETISRTLVLAQRTADSTIADAQAEAASITAAARAESARELDQARTEAARVLDDARAAARRSKDDEQRRIETEVKELHARREALLGDIDQLERHVATERSRVKEASQSLAAIADGMPPESARPVMLAPAAPLDIGDEAPPLTPPLVTGQIPVTPMTGQVPARPGVEAPAATPPVAVDEARSTWSQAENSGLIDATPPEGMAVSFDAPIANGNGASVRSSRAN